MVESGIAVMGHVGLLPQSISVLGGFRPQGQSAASAIQVIEDAKVHTCTADIQVSLAVLVSSCVISACVCGKLNRLMLSHACISRATHSSEAQTCQSVHFENE